MERADGGLKSLFVVDALVITDETLNTISELNPGLKIISVPGCTGLDVENFVEAHSLRAQARGLPGISQVHLRGLYNISSEHLLRLGSALGVSRLPQSEASLRRRYYGNRQRDIEATDKRPVDVELCLYCKNVRLIYDCTIYKDRAKDDGCSDHSSSEDEDYNDLEEDEYKNGKTCIANGKPCMSCSCHHPVCSPCRGLS